MKPLEATPDLLKAARSVVWFQLPEETIRDPIRFLAYAMTFGGPGDLLALQKSGVSIDEYAEVLDHAPPGIFDRRSWAYWNLKCGRSVVPPLPVRNVP